MHCVLLCHELRRVVVECVAMAVENMCRSGVLFCSVCVVTSRLGSLKGVAERRHGLPANAVHQLDWRCGLILLPDDVHVQEVTILPLSANLHAEEFLKVGHVGDGVGRPG